MINNLKQRWVAETPIVAKKLRNTAITLGGISLAVLALSTIPGIALPAIVFSVASKVALCATIIAPTAQLQKKKED